MSDISLRYATKDDGLQILKWRNHSSVRAHIFDPVEIPLDQHLRWFESVLNDEDRHLLIAVNPDGDEFAVLRFDVIDANDAEVSIYLAPDYHGRGLGFEVLQAGTAWAKKHLRASNLVAKVLMENVASQKIFEKASYQAEYIQYKLTLK